jgi:hypothetical protein
LSAAEIIDESWYPGGIATALLEAEGAPAGFARYRMSTRWGTHDLFHPISSPEDSQWWSEVISNSGWWGESPDISGAEITEFSADGKAWKATWKDSGPAGWSGQSVEIRCLPLDSHGHAKVLAEVDSKNLLSALGGLQFDGRDILVILPEPEQPSALEVISDLVRAQDEAGLNSLAARLGRELGVFAACIKPDNHCPNTQRIWNNQLKKLEDWSKANTLWRAPHAFETQGTITHRNIGLEVMHISPDEVRISGCYDGLFNAIIGQEQNNPAIRDLAALFTSLGENLGRLDGQRYEEGMRKAMLAGWSASAPERWSHQRALDTHRGGLTIWEYEQQLERLVLAKAWNREVAPSTRTWLAKVSRLQASMFGDRIWAAISLVCWSSAAIITALWLDGGASTEVALAVPPLLFAGYGLRRWYHSRAHPPWLPF